MLHRNEEARRLWRAVYPTLSAGHPGLLGMVTARAEAQVTRLACIYALGDASSMVRVEHLQAALALWHYCFQSARCLFGDRTGNDVADRILDGLRVAETQGLTRTEVSKLLQGHSSTDKTDMALDFLADHGLAQQEMDRSKSGRPTERWFAAREPELGQTGETSELSRRPDPETGVSSHISHPGGPETRVSSHSSHSAPLAEEADDGADVARF